MLTKGTLLALLLTGMTAGAFAQSSAEFGRASGGQIDLSVKAPSQFSGSLSATMSRSAGPSMFGFNRYAGTAGGTIVKDRVWFFATAEQNSVPFSSTIPQSPQFDAKMSAELGSRNSLGALFLQRGASMQMGVPSSFLSLHYTGIVSSNSFFTATVSHSQAQ